MIAAAMSNARATAIKEQKYAGIRFQTATDGNQYMVFIVNDPSSMAKGSIANGFVAVIGQKPIKLPGDGRVMDLEIRKDYTQAKPSDSDEIIDNGGIDTEEELRDTTTFTIIFSSAGKLVTHQVWVRNRDCLKTGFSADKVFNTDTVVNAGDALLYQDDYPAEGLGQEYSRKSFIIFDKKTLDAVDTDFRWTDYLSKLEKIYLNPYTGELVGGLLQN
jgi:hypothetical protein